jgi:hypothetical protein
MQKYTNNVQTVNGKAVPNALVTVTLFGGGAATIYSDNGVTVQPNPIYTDAYGVFSFYAADGRYTISTTYSGVTTTSTDILLEDPVDGSSALAASSGSSLVGFIQSGTGAVARTLEEKLLEVAVSVKDFGAVGDGATDDTLKFTALEAGHSGKSVDLLGLVYVVSAIPNGNDYFNGAFSVSGVEYWKQQNPRLHPFDGTASLKVLRPELGIYRVPVGPFAFADNLSTYHIYTEQLNHGVDTNKVLKGYKSNDYGETITATLSDKLIYKDASYSLGPFASGNMNGRWGAMFSRVDTVGTYYDPVFIYSDDEGVTWNSSTHGYGGSGLARSDFHSRIYPWPTSAGGDDTNGFIVYAYAGSFGIVAWTTIDKGATWTPIPYTLQRTAENPLSEVAAFSEMSVARVGTENRWVMVGRTGVTSGFASTSTDMINWTPAKLIPNLNLRGNPPELIYDDGRLYFFGFSRQGSKEILPNHSNALLVGVGDPDQIFDTQGKYGWSGWKVITNISFWPTGYISTLKLRDRWHFYFVGGEDVAGGTTGRTGLMYMLSNDIAETASVKSLLANVNKPNIVKTGCMRYWPLGTSFAAGATRQPIWPGVTFARSSFNTGATVTRVTGDKAAYATRVRRDDGNALTTTIVLAFVLSTDDSLPFRSQQVHISFRARKGSGFSAANNTLIARARQTTTGDQVVTNAAGSFPVGDTSVSSASTSVTLGEDWAQYDYFINLVLDTTNQLLFQMYWTPVGTASEDWYEFELFKIHQGIQSSPFVFEPISDVKAWSDRIVQVKTVRAINGTRYIQFTPKMQRTPSVTLSVGTAANISADGFDLIHTADADVTVTANASL